MATIVKKSIYVDAAPQKIFDFLIDPTNLPSIWPSLIEVKDIVDLPNGGHRYAWLYKMGGIQFKGISEDIIMQPGRMIRAQVEGEITASIEWLIEADGNRSQVTLTSEYSVPLRVVGRMAEAIIKRMNDHEAELIVYNLMFVMQDIDKLSAELGMS